MLSDSHPRRWLTFDLGLHAYACITAATGLRPSSNLCATPSTPESEYP